MSRPPDIVGVDEVLPPSVLQDLADSLTRLAGLPVYFARPDGRLLTRSRNETAVCSRLTTAEDIHRPCLSCQRMTFGLDGTGWPEDTDVALRHPCPLGLSDVVLPIRSGDRVVALIGTPHVATAAEALARARAVLSQAEVEAGEIGRFLAAVEVHDESRLTDVRASVRAIAELVLSLGGEALSARAEAEKLETLARTDALTGMENRRQAALELESAWNLAQRHGRPFGVLLFDIDQFKRINDTCGHALGDQVLVRLADLLAHNMRASDRCFRFGGEEFLVVCHESDSAVVAKAAERVRAAVAHTHFPVWGVPPVTVSVGAAAWPACEVVSADDLVHRADVALYAAKNAGRNRVRCAAAGDDASAVVASQTTEIPRL